MVARNSTESQNTEATPASESPVVTPRWQFRLRHLFALMTYVAVVVAVATRWGIETLPTTIGLGIAWLNYLGILLFLQRGKLQLVVLFIAWGMFLVSMFLPTHTTWGVPGWFGVYWALTTPITAACQKNWRVLLSVLWYAPVIDVANLSQLLLPVTATRLRMGRGKYLAAVNCISMVAVWAIAGPTAASGYIVWSISFLLGLTAMPLTRVTLVVMHIILASQIAYWLIFPGRW